MPKSLLDPVFFFFLNEKFIKDLVDHLEKSEYGLDIRRYMELFCILFGVTVVF